MAPVLTSKKRTKPQASESTKKKKSKKENSSSGGSLSLDNVKALGHQLLSSRAHINNLPVLISLLSPAAPLDLAIESLVSLQSFFLPLLREIPSSSSVLRKRSETRTFDGEEKDPESVYKVWIRQRLDDFVDKLIEIAVSEQSADAVRDVALEAIMDFVKLGKDGRFQLGVYNRFLHGIVSSTSAVDPLIDLLGSKYFKYIDIRYFTYTCMEKIIKNLESRIMSEFGNVSLHDDEEISKAGKVDFAVHIIYNLLSQFPPLELEKEQSYATWSELGGMKTLVLPCQVESLLEWPLRSSLWWIHSDMKTLGWPLAGFDAAIGIALIRWSFTNDSQLFLVDDRFEHGLIDELQILNEIENVAGLNQPIFILGWIVSSTNPTCLSFEEPENISSNDLISDTEPHGLKKANKNVPSISHISKKIRLRFTKAWISFLRLPLPVDVYKQVLASLHQSIIPYMTNPSILCDFLTRSYDIGGVISVMALNGLFILMTQCGVEYPKFYGKLYALLTPAVFMTKFRASFFHLLDTCLKSSYFPAYLAAAFAKKFSRLALSVPPSGELIIIALIHNLLRRHPSINFLVHQPLGQENNDVPMENTGSIEESRDPAVSKKIGTDPFDDNESDPAKSNAMRSSLWEIETLRHHYSPAVSRFVASLENDLTVRAKTSEVTVADFASGSYATVFRDEELTMIIVCSPYEEPFDIIWDGASLIFHDKCWLLDVIPLNIDPLIRRRIKQVPLAFYQVIPPSLFSDSDFPGWTFGIQNNEKQETKAAPNEVAA
ncbi:hypothetical protein ZIOFF_019557 [Zingiber officinale]|uniref:CCAAT-binding factor domain-containing protein n=1 Tax=Zingiber officinale TaxID=94328 RepID=A0A8J5LBR7_ZINOF|nr:hypothetical protein ZIOFF_019557 [Zingiber officinale]